MRTGVFFAHSCIICTHALGKVECFGMKGDSLMLNDDKQVMLAEFVLAPDN